MLKNNYDMKEYFKSERINLISIEKKHIKLIKKWINNENITMYMGRRFPINDDEQFSWYENFMEDKSKKKLIISTIPSNHNIGMISLFEIDCRNQKSEIGVYIKPDYHGKGYAKESINMILNFAFQELNMHKIYALIHSFNISAIKLFKSCNFHHESTDRESIYFNGKFVNVDKYSIFRSYFKNEKDSSNTPA